MTMSVINVDPLLSLAWLILVFNFMVLRRGLATIPESIVVLLRLGTRVMLD